MPGYLLLVILIVVSKMRSCGIIKTGFASFNAVVTISIAAASIFAEEDRLTFAALLVLGDELRLLFK